MIEALPLTRSGKVDTRALPAPPMRELKRSQGRPRNATEVQLLSIWARVLGVADLGVIDDFFEFGGNSLLALRLFADIETTIGRTLPLATLFQAPTVRQLAGYLAEGRGEEAWSCLVPIQPRGNGPPFVCVHGGNGNVINMRRLAPRLDQDRPFYVLQARGLDGRTAPFHSIPRMAAHYVAELLRARPDEPCVVGGFCFGALVAFEMACQLVEAGAEVPLVILIDAPPAPGTEAHGSRRPKLTPGSRLGVLLRRAGFRRGRDPRSWVRHEHGIAGANYVPRRYGGDVLQFMSSDWSKDRSTKRERALGWSGLIDGEHDFREVAGDHGLLFWEPSIGIIAEAINEKIAGL